MTDYVFPRLLRYPHQAVFDLSPEPELAFRLSHPSGTARWSIGDSTFNATENSTVHVYAFSVYQTVGALIDKLRYDGFTVDAQNSMFSRMASTVLVQGEGAEYESNGDRIFAFTSLLWVLLHGYAREIIEARGQITNALLQMFLQTASGQWLDLWGQLYGVLRLQLEADAQYRARIPREAFRARVNARAIEQAILDQTGYDVRIEEPFQELFILDESLLSGPHKMYDGDTVGYHLIQPVAYTIVDWDVVYAVINRNRAAGVLILPPRLIYRSEADAGIDGTAESIVWLRFAADLLSDGVARLDAMDIEDISTLNEKFLIRSTSRVAFEVIVDPGTYLTESLIRGNQALYGMEAIYHGQYWNQALISWADAGSETWESLNVICETSIT